MRRLILSIRARSRPFLFDSLLALALTALVQLDLQYWLLSHYWLLVNPAPNVALGLLQTVPIAWRRRAPLTVLIIVVSALVIRHPLGLVVGINYGLLGVLVCLYTVVAYGDRRRAAIGAAIAVAAAPILWIVEPLDVRSWTVFAGVRSGALMAGAWILGRAARRGWESKAQRAVAEERLRIARELHDVVAHSVTVLAVQAGAARMSFDANPDHARQTLAFIESKSRQVLTEMRRLLGILRPKEDQAPVLAPQPSMQSLDSLVDEFREAGLGVGVTIEGEPRPLSAGLELSVYRIVQEALTNALRHAGPTKAQLCLRYRPETLEVEIFNEGVSSEASMTGRDGGYGLVGMQERVELFGGDFYAGSRSGGGFEVKVRLPLETSGQ